ncbi:craniofacial development protein 2-like [Mytilus edulis]|uniref:craniofacial development protein 2-like n=1 Tax=Mytilus edulis TaxID=6550 RepID=UPI0039EFA9C0
MGNTEVRPENRNQLEGLMNDVGQTQNQLEANIRREPLVHPRKQIKVGCWNVRTMYAPGKTYQVVNEMNNYGIDVLGISECRWTGTGKINLRGGETMLYSGQTERHEYGVALIISKANKKTLMEWQPINERIITARFFSRHIKLTIIQCYAPTNDASDEVKEEFYQTLNDVTAKVHKHDMIIVMGDMNAKIGSDNVGYEDIMGKNGYGVINENGELFRDYCQTNNIVICSSIFKHKDIHKYTWTSPDGNIKNQIDHITIDKRFRGSMEDVRSYRGADVGSDHELLISRVKLKLCRQRVNQGQKKRYDTDKLKIPKVAQEFKLELRNRFQVLGETDGIEEQWIDIKQAICEVGEQTLGFKDRKQPEWITTNSIHKIQERKQIKQKINATRSQRQKE